MTESRTISTLDGKNGFAAYVARPAGDPKAAIVVIQEIFGVNAGIRRKCDTLAEAGYLAYAPDLFWQLEPGIELDPDIEPEMKRALLLMGEFDQDQGVRDIEATIKTARDEVDGGKVGVIGYCLGGRLAFMAATRTDSDASVGYYGVGIDELAREADAISNPVLLHIPQEDHFVDKETQRRMHEALDDHPEVTLYDYAGEDHGFATQFGERRSEKAADLADQRTAEFFATNLG